MPGIGQGLARLVHGPGREELQQDRQMVRQFRPDRFEATRPVGLQQVDHRRAARPALAMHVLEEIERERARAVEEEHETLLQVVEIARAEIAQQRFQLRHPLLGDQRLGAQQGRDLRRRRLQIGARIAQQRRHCLEGHVHGFIASGMVSPRFLPPKSEPDEVPVEQPLPSVKPQPPRRPMMSSSASSRWAVGMTKRSS